MKFSVVIPMYNTAPYVEATVRSVLAQEYGDFEVIVVNDGSTDGCEKIIAAMDDPRIVLINKPNTGVSDTRNVGCRAAKGEYIAFLDSDDYWYPNHLGEAAAFFDEHPECSLIAFGKESFQDGCWMPGMLIHRSEVQICDVSTTVTLSPYERYFWQCAYRRDRYGDIRFDGRIKYNMGEDILFSVEVNERSDFELRILDALYGYRLREGSAMHSFFSAIKCKFDFVHYSLVLNRILKSKKRYDPYILRVIGLRVTEGMTRRMWQIDKKGKDDAWHALFDLHGELSQNPLMPCWVRFVAFIMSKVRSRLLYYILCGIPFELKYLGLHR